MQTIIWPSKEHFFARVKNRDDLLVLVRELGWVVTEENKHKHKDSLAQIIHNWEKEDGVYFLDKLVVNTFKTTTHFKLLLTVPKSKAYDCGRLNKIYNLASEPLTFVPSISLLDLLLSLIQKITDQETVWRIISVKWMLKAVFLGHIRF